MNEHDSDEHGNEYFGGHRHRHHGGNGGCGRGSPDRPDSSRDQRKQAFRGGQNFRV